MIKYYIFAKAYCRYSFLAVAERGKPQKEFQLSGITYVGKPNSTPQALK